MSDRLTGEIFGADQMCFGCGPRHPIGFRLAFERAGAEVITRFTPTERHQGPPGIMHGGLVTTLADELADWAVIALEERFGFTASIECRLEQPIRIGREVIGRARVVRATRRIVDVEVELAQEGGRAFRGQFRFVVLDQAAAEKMLGRPLPAEWVRFTR